MKLSTISLILLAGILPALSASSFAQEGYPSKPIRLIVPYPPGGPTDIIGRLTSSVLTKRLSENVVVDNRGGRGQSPGRGDVAKAVIPVETGIQARSYN